MKKNLYQIIVDDLSKAIRTGQLTANSKVPTEQELAQQYQVSRITSKRALNELEQAGLIYRKQGSGSFVQPHQQTSEPPIKTPSNNISTIKLSISYIVISNRFDPTLTSLATQLLLLLKPVTTSFALLSLKELDTKLTAKERTIDQIILLGDHFDENTIYQLYQLNIPFLQIATILDPLERPQLILSMVSAIQNLLSILPTNTTRLFYYTDTTKYLSAYSDQAIKVDLLKSTRQYPNYHLQLLTEQTKSKLSELVETDALIFENFYTLLDYYLMHPSPMPTIYLLAWYLTPDQLTFLREQHIQTFYIDQSELLNLCRQFLMSTKKDVAVISNITVNAKNLLSLNESDQSLDF